MSKSDSPFIQDPRNGDPQPDEIGGTSMREEQPSTRDSQDGRVLGNGFKGNKWDINWKEGYTDNSRISPMSAFSQSRPPSPSHDSVFSPLSNTPSPMTVRTPDADESQGEWLSCRGEAPNHQRSRSKPRLAPPIPCNEFARDQLKSEPYSLQKRSQKALRHPDADVTPWHYQRFEDIVESGDAPVYHNPTTSIPDWLEASEKRKAASTVQARPSRPASAATNHSHASHSSLHEVELLKGASSRLSLVRKLRERYYRSPMRSESQTRSNDSLASSNQANEKNAGTASPKRQPSEVSTVSKRNESLKDNDNIEQGDMKLGSAVSELSGIVKNPEQYNSQPTSNSTMFGSTWNAPESWAVSTKDHYASMKVRKDKKHTLFRVQITDGPEIANNKDVPSNDSTSSSRRSSVNYCMRVFRSDETFATVSCSLGTTAAELAALLGKKFFVSNPSDHRIILTRKGQARELSPREKPFVIQKRMLEQAGHTSCDRLEDLGREDHSYLCRFEFVDSSNLPRTSQSLCYEKDDMREIDLSGTELQHVPIVLYKHAGCIRSLDLSENLSADLPLDFLQSCYKLEELRLSRCEIEEVRENITSLYFLALLDLSHNQITDITSARLHSILGLQQLFLQNNRISKLPSEFGLGRNLVHLDLSTNYLTTLPSAITEIKSLVKLDLSFNRVQSISPSISKLTCLEVLRLNNNDLKQLPTNFGKLNNLRDLDLRNNSLTNLDILQQMHGLREVYCDQNPVTSAQAPCLNLRKWSLCKTPLTVFENPSLSTFRLQYLDLSKTKLSTLNDEIFGSLTELEVLRLDGNHLTSIPAAIGILDNLVVLSATQNLIAALPPEIGCCSKLTFLDVHANNLKTLPAEIWNLTNLNTLNVSSNILTILPAPPIVSESSTRDTPGEPHDFHYGGRSVFLPESSKSLPQIEALSESLELVNRKNSATSLGRAASTMIASLQFLLLGDNRLTDDCFEAICLFENLNVLNLSYNEIFEVPAGAFARMQGLRELYLSGNELTSLPGDDFTIMQSLRVLHVNGNKMQSIPAELGKIEKLEVLDVGTNLLKYNISNWPYDWNWNWNPELRYLNMSGNKKLEINHNHVRFGDRELSDFSALTKLRTLGLIDVTITIPTIPDESEDRRVRTSGSELNRLLYGMADTLGKTDHLSTIDLVSPRFRGNEDEYLFGIFDGNTVTTSGNKVTRFLQEFFVSHLETELKRAAGDPRQALRRTFLGLNRDLGLAVNPVSGRKENATSLTVPAIMRHSLTPSVVRYLNTEDCDLGASVVTVYITGKEMYVANVGDALGVMSKSDGGAVLMSRKHNASDSDEFVRVREAGGFVDQQGRINVQGCPSITHLTISESDEFLIVANKELWEYISYQTAVDIARTRRDDPMRAAEKLRDFAISYGSHSKIMVMIIDLSKIFTPKHDIVRVRNATANRGIGMLFAEEEFLLNYRSKLRRGKEELPEDSTLARLSREVAPPTGEVAMVFTDIKNSTLLWETQPVAMRSAIKLHNSIMRRQLRTIGGYEVKNEGDAFMVCFPTVTSALLWCFTVQMQLLRADWPTEILSSPHCAEVFSSGGELLYRGLSVRMGIHWGSPVCEVDPITRRMDYFGPMVNRASRISDEADGGQITISIDLYQALQRLEKLPQAATHGNTEVLVDETILETISRDMGALKRIGYNVNELGHRKLKGLETMEWIALIFPSNLVDRLSVPNLPVLRTEPSESREDSLSWDDRSKVLSTLHSLTGILWRLVVRLERISAGGRGIRIDPDNATWFMLFHETLLSRLPDDESGVAYLIMLSDLVTRVENTTVALIHNRAGVNTGELLVSTKEQIAHFLLGRPGTDNLRSG